MLSLGALFVTNITNGTSISGSINPGALKYMLFYVIK